MLKQADSGLLNKPELLLEGKEIKLKAIHCPRLVLTLVPFEVLIKNE
jgi:hypothetical protein